MSDQKVDLQRVLHWLQKQHAITLATQLTLIGQLELEVAQYGALCDQQAEQIATLENVTGEDKSDG